MPNDFLPAWIDSTKWFAESANGRWAGSQAVLLILGDEGQAGAMAALRGVANSAPAWLIQDAWDRAGNSRMADAVTLEHHALLDVALETQAMFRRAEAVKNCQHEWAPDRSTLGRACAHCGFVEDLRVGYGPN